MEEHAILHNIRTMRANMNAWGSYFSYLLHEFKSPF